MTSDRDGGGGELAKFRPKEGAGCVNSVLTRGGVSNPKKLSDVLYGWLPGKRPCHGGSMEGRKGGRAREGRGQRGFPEGDSHDSHVVRTGWTLARLCSNGRRQIFSDEEVQS